MVNINTSARTHHYQGSSTILLPLKVYTLFVTLPAVSSDPMPRLLCVQITLDSLKVSGNETR